MAKHRSQIYLKLILVKYLSPKKKIYIYIYTYMSHGQNLLLGDHMEIIEIIQGPCRMLATLYVKSFCHN